MQRNTPLAWECGVEFFFYLENAQLLEGAQLRGHCTYELSSEPQSDAPNSINIYSFLWLKSSPNNPELPSDLLIIFHLVRLKVSWSFLIASFLPLFPSPFN